MLKPLNERYGSHLKVGPVTSSAENSIYGEYVLRVGVVTKIIYPMKSDGSPNDESESKKFIEYVVNVFYKDMKNGTFAPRDFRCTVMNLFGGLADYSTYTLRPSDPSTSKAVWGTGSKVLILCENAEYYKSHIIGGIRDTLNDELDQDRMRVGLGHFWNFRFNGIDWNVNKNGELTITYTGASKIDGTTDVEDTIAGTKIQMLSNGNLQFATNSDEEILIIDKANKQISLNVEGEKVIIKKEGVNVGDANEAWILGTTYRKNEAKLNNNIKSKLMQLSTTIQAMSSVAQGQITTMGLDPLLAGAVSPLTTLSSTLQQIAATLNGIVTELTTFEAQSTKYISKKNFGD